jgi:hypothetical protein
MSKLDTNYIYELKCEGINNDSLKCPLNSGGINGTVYFQKEKSSFKMRLDRMELYSNTVGMTRDGSEDYSKLVDSIKTNIAYDSLLYFSGHLVYE